MDPSRDGRRGPIRKPACDRDEILLGQHILAIRASARDKSGRLDPDLRATRKGSDPILALLYGAAVNSEALASQPIPPGALKDTENKRQSSVPQIQRDRSIHDKLRV